MQLNFVYLSDSILTCELDVAVVDASLRAMRSILRLGWRPRKLRIGQRRRKATDHDALLQHFRFPLPNGSSFIATYQDLFNFDVDSIKTRMFNRDRDH